MNSETTMPHIAFDTLAYANKLKAVGMDAKIAETQAELQATILNDFATNQLATKKDLQELKFELLIKLGGIVVASTAVLGTLIALFSRIN